MIGDLYITDLPEAVNEDVLYENLGQMQYIHGALQVRDNKYLTSLTFLRNVIEIHLGYFANNPNLVDARMPWLQDIRDNVTFVDCNRLCLDYYTALSYIIDGDGDCSMLKVVSYLQLEGDIQTANMSSLGSIVANAAVSLSDDDMVWV